jgi:hypothetical protein
MEWYIFIFKKWKDICNILISLKSWLQLVIHEVFASINQWWLSWRIKFWTYIAQNLHYMSLFSLVCKLIKIKFDLKFSLLFAPVICQLPSSHMCLVVTLLDGTDRTFPLLQKDILDWIILDNVYFFFCSFFVLANFFFSFFFCSGRAWTQGLHNEPLRQLFFCDRLFQDRVSRTIYLVWLQTMILLISASWVARIAGMNHRHPALYLLMLNNGYKLLL